MNTADEDIVALALELVGAFAPGEVEVGQGSTSPGLVSRDRLSPFVLNPAA